MAPTPNITEPQVRILSKHTIKPPPHPHQQSPLTIHLTPLDLKLISVDYVQQGLLFRTNQLHDIIIEKLKSSLALTLSHFFPLAGRLAVAHRGDSMSISLECNDRGAEFIHAVAPDIAVADIIEPLYTPKVVLSFFTLNTVPNFDGHALPLLAVQATELSDGLFIGMSSNHCVSDGSSFWHIFNTWSEICRTGSEEIKNPPVLDRWFLESHKPPVKLPFASESEFVKRYQRPEVTECVFEFSAEVLASLKTKANEEMGTERLSSLQSLLAHLWRCVTRARRLEPDADTTYIFLMDARARLTPPLPAEYFGNAVFAGHAVAKAGDVMMNGLGWTAMKFNEIIASYTDDKLWRDIKAFIESPTFHYMQTITTRDLITGNSPRFNMYGNDFGWGKPVTVRSGWGNKRDGKANVYPGPEKGSIALEVNLVPEVLELLVNDHEFMDLVTKK